MSALTHNILVSSAMPLTAWEVILQAGGKVKGLICKLNPVTVVSYDAGSKQLMVLDQDGSPTAGDFHTLMSTREAALEHISKAYGTKANVVTEGES